MAWWYRIISYLIVFFAVEDRTEGFPCAREVLYHRALPQSTILVFFFFSAYTDILISKNVLQYSEILLKNKFAIKSWKLKLLYLLENG